MTKVDDFFADLDSAHPSPLDALAGRLEQATDAYAKACDDAAEAENRYLRRYAEAFLSLDVPATVKPKTAECIAVEERVVWNIKAAAEKSARQKCEELRTRLMAWMSYQRVVGSQT